MRDEIFYRHWYRAGYTMSMLRVISILLLCFILINLFVGLFHLLRNKGDSNKVVRSLTIRVALSILLFVFILVAARFGLSPNSHRHMPNYRLNRTHVDASPPPPPPNAALHGKFITLAPLVYENAVFEQLHAASHGDNKRQSVWSFLPYGPFPDAAVMCAYYQEYPKITTPCFTAFCTQTVLSPVLSVI